MYKHRSRGFILIAMMVVILVSLSLLGVWYQQIILQTHLTQQVVQQKIMFVECKSLTVILLKRINQSSISKQEAQKDFYTVNDENGIRWTVSRSAIVTNIVQFTFYNHDSKTKIIITRTIK
ncbi:MAG: Tfp pilus assembly protein PilX [bacterium]|jgi:Tfp pilus assembly protein PilX